MFIKDGKSLFGNVGLMVSLLILIILLVFSYNRCVSFVEKFELIDTTDVESPLTEKNIEFPPPKNVRININGSTISVNFSVNMSSSNMIPNKYMIVLVQYDYNLQPTGNNKFYISNEYSINSNVVFNENINNTNLCNIVNGFPSCQYIFNNLDIVDTVGNPYYYKIGVSAVYKDGNSIFETPYNVSNTNKLFALSSNIQNQNNQFQDFIKFKQLQTQSQSSNYGSATSTVDGQYEFIKSQLGGYPSNLIMDPTSSKQNLLTDLVDKSMSQAVLNINVSSTPTPQ
jgi:hypothetical protein